MRLSDARRFLILWGLIITGAQMSFLMVAPSLGFPLGYPKNLDLLQIISPVFLGYLGAASHFIFQPEEPEVSVRNQYLELLLKGPIFIYFIAVAAAFVAFGYSNRVGATIGEGMSVENLSTALTICLGLLAVTTGILSSYLFASRKGVSAAS